MKKNQHPNLILRRLLLDGVKIIEPYRRALRDVEPGDAEHVANLNREIALMQTWVSMARVTALKLKRAASGKTSEPAK